jgi:hypothetical protein
MSLAQLRKELDDLKKVITCKDSGISIPDTPEALMCFEEFNLAKERARKRLTDNGIAENELKENERMSFIFDEEVLKAEHNLLRACWNAQNQDKQPIKINYLFNLQAGL